MKKIKALYYTIKYAIYLLKDLHKGKYEPIVNANNVVISPPFDVDNPPYGIQLLSKDTDDQIASYFKEYQYTSKEITETLYMINKVRLRNLS